jgi:hypothetical protein
MGKAGRSRPFWGSIVLLAVSLAVRRFNKEGRSLFELPHCAWRFMGTGSPGVAFNIAYPDSSSIYHVMQLSLGEGDEFKIVGESFPYARYFSFQTYELPWFMSQQSVKDVDIVPDFGINAYRDLDAAMRGQKQGGYTIYITPGGDKNYTNELRGLPVGRTSGHFDLFFRVYVEEGQKPPAQAPWAHIPRDSELEPEKWGWAPPPRLFVKRRALGDHWREIPMCSSRMQKGFKLLDYLAELLPPLRNGEGILKENMPHNFFLPKYSDRKGYMASKDAMYIASMADHAVLGEGRDLWARVTGKLPRTPGSLYSAPFIANVSDYQVRYVSLSTGSRTFPCRNHETMSDWELEAFYKGWVRERYGDAAEWDRMYTIWVGPPTATKLPKMAEDQPGPLMQWIPSAWSGKTVRFPGMLYRQVLAVSQMPEMHHMAAHPSALSEVVPERCRGRLNNFGSGVVAGVNGTHEDVCCGMTAPDWCFLPDALKYRMGDYYPLVTYYASPDGDELIPL